MERLPIFWIMENQGAMSSVYDWVSIDGIKNIKMKVKTHRK